MRRLRHRSCSGCSVLEFLAAAFLFLQVLRLLFQGFAVLLGLAMGFLGKTP